MKKLFGLISFLLLGCCVQLNDRTNQIIQWYGQKVEHHSKWNRKSKDNGCCEKEPISRESGMKYAKTGERAGFLGSWRTSEEINKIDFSKLDFVYYAHFDADDEKCILSPFEKAKAREGEESTFDSLKKVLNKTRVVASIGGWDYSPRFYKALFLQSERKAEDFVKKCVDLLTELEVFDGIDLNIEFPCPSRVRCREAFEDVGVNDSRRFTQVVRQFRKHLGPDFYLSVTVPGSEELLGVFNFQAIAREIDSVNLMAYDLASRLSKLTNHQAAVRSTATQPVSAETSIKKLLSLGMPSSKVRLGVPFYAVVFHLIGSCLPEDLAVCKADSDRSIKGKLKDTEYKAIKQLLLNNKQPEEYDYKAESAYFIRERELYSFDNEKSVRAKVKLAEEKKLLGLFAWELGMDDGSLLKAMAASK